MAGRSYVNNLTAEDGRKVHEVWGANYTRLVTVKQRYDPGNVFRLNHNIDPSAGDAAACHRPFGLRLGLGDRRADDAEPVAGGEFEPARDVRI